MLKSKVASFVPRGVSSVMRAALLLVAVAALAFASPAAAKDGGWWTSCRHERISREFKIHDEEHPRLPIEIFHPEEDVAFAIITYDELRNLVKDLPRILRAIKACDAWRKCLDDREAGKVKHCYENDLFFTHSSSLSCGGTSTT